MFAARAAASRRCRLRRATPSWTPSPSCSRNCRECGAAPASPARPASCSSYRCSCNWSGSRPRSDPLLIIILYHTVSDIVSINVQSNFINYSLIIDRRLDNSWSDCLGAQAERPAEPAAARPRPRHSLP